MRIHVTFSDGELDQIIANLCLLARIMERSGERVPFSLNMQIGMIGERLETARRQALALIDFSFGERTLIKLQAALMFLGTLIESRADDSPQADGATQKAAEVIKACFALAGKLGDARRGVHQAKAEKKAAGGWWWWWLMKPSNSL
jgi:hypothetical protein